MLCNLCGKPLEGKAMYCDACQAQLGFQKREPKTEDSKASEKPQSATAPGEQKDGAENPAEGQPAEAQKSGSATQEPQLGLSQQQRIYRMAGGALLLGVAGTLAWMLLRGPDMSDREQMLISSSSSHSAVSSEQQFPKILSPSAPADPLPLTDSPQSDSAPADSLIPVPERLVPQRRVESEQDFTNILPTQATIAALMTQVPDTGSMEPTPASTPAIAGAPKVSAVRFMGAKREFIDYRAVLGAERNSVRIYFSQNDLSLVQTSSLLRHSEIDSPIGLPRGIDFALEIQLPSGRAATECTPKDPAMVRAYIYRAGIAGFPIPGKASVVSASPEQLELGTQALSCTPQSDGSVTLGGQIEGRATYMIGQAEYPIHWDLKF